MLDGIYLKINFRGQLNNILSDHIPLQRDAALTNLGHNHINKILRLNAEIKSKIKNNFF